MDSHREGAPAGHRHERATPARDEDAGDALAADGPEADGPPADERRADGRRAVEEPAGDSVCWLDRVCPECGGLTDGAPAPVCPRCGTQRA